MLAAVAAFGPEWGLYHKVTFDGVNRLVIVAPAVSEVSVKVDIYSSWKEWLLLATNSKYEPAIRSIGGDPIGGGIYAGDIYFLMNNWRIYVDHAVNFTGVLYSDDGGSPFVTPSDANIVQSTASNLALAYGYTPTQEALIAALQAQTEALYKLAGLQAGKPLTVTSGTRSVDDITQTIVESPPGTITVTRT